jgi:hypothetical protein
MALAQEPIYQRKDIYEPLDNRSREIRIISLRPGLYSEPLECDLIRTSLANPSRYEKLSYTWGSPELVSQILVNDHELHIHGSLDVALRHLRLKDSPRTLWTDAICINQANTSERSSQVAMMSQVYESVGAVLVWLGLASEDSHLAVDLLTEIRLNEFVHDYVLSSVRNRDNLLKWKALFGLCRREYWNRIWTAQEIICDKDAILICGQDSMAFADVAQVAWILQGLYYGEALSVPGILEAGLDKLRVQSNYRAMQNSHRAEKEPDLLTLMTTFRAHKCSDVRDKVYGMASMARDVRDTTFRIDYNLPTGQVYLQAARWTIESTKKLNVLCCRLGQDPALGLPSWAPDWTSKRFQNQLSTTAGYIATGYTSTDAEFSHDSRILTVTGCCLGKVDVLGEAYTEARPEVFLTDQMKETIREWLRLALQGSSSAARERSLDKENDRINTFWRTLICNRAEPPYQLNEKWYRSMFDVARGAVAVPEEGIQDSMISDEEKLQGYVTPLVASLDNRMFGRRFFSSGDALGMMGMGPTQVELGDHICLLMGCDIPIILRSEGHHFVLVGEAYVHGFMQGEADTMIQSRRLPLRKFSIH